MKKLQKDDIFETERLIIKLAQPSEAEKMYALIDDFVTQFMAWDKWDDHTDTEKNLRESIEEAEKGVSWQAAIYLKNGWESNIQERKYSFPTKWWELIGRFGIHTINEDLKSVMLGYWLAADYRWQGYISECVEWIKHYGFTEMWLHKISIRCVKENTWSRRVAEKAWFKLDGIIRHDELQKGKYVDNCYYSFLREEYR